MAAWELLTATTAYSYELANNLRAADRQLAALPAPVATMSAEVTAEAILFDEEQAKLLIDGIDNAASRNPDSDPVNYHFARYSGRGGTQENPHRDLALRLFRRSFAQQFAPEGVIATDITQDKVFTAGVLLTTNLVKLLRESRDIEPLAEAA